MARELFLQECLLPITWLLCQNCLHFPHESCLQDRLGCPVSGTHLGGLGSHCVLTCMEGEVGHSRMRKAGSGSKQLGDLVHAEAGGNWGEVSVVREMADRADLRNSIVFSLIHKATYVSAGRFMSANYWSFCPGFCFEMLDTWKHQRN